MQQKPKILVVDDEERFRSTLKKMLMAQGLEVVALGSGKAALAEITQNPYDVIILDVRMPEMDGMETLAKIKTINPTVEVIILSGHASIDTAVEIMKLGGSEYLLKPCSIEDLMDKIEGAYERKLAQEARQSKTTSDR